MSIDVLCSLAATLGVSTDYILFGSENSSPLDNVIALLKDQPERFIILIEKTIRFYLENDIECSN